MKVKRKLDCGCSNLMNYCEKHSAIRAESKRLQDENAAFLMDMKERLEEEDKEQLLELWKLRAEQLLADKQRLEEALAGKPVLKSEWEQLCEERDQLRRELDEAREYLRAPVGMEMMKRIAALEAELDDWRYVGNLLARVHRDGGHYISNHGLRKATEDAEEIVLQERERIYKLESLIRKLDTCLNSDVWNTQATTEEQELLRKIVEEK